MLDETNDRIIPAQGIMLVPKTAFLTLSLPTMTGSLWDFAGPCAGMELSHLPKGKHSPRLMNTSGFRTVQCRASPHTDSRSENSPDISQLINFLPLLPKQVGICLKLCGAIPRTCHSSKVPTQTAQTTLGFPAPRAGQRGLWAAVSFQSLVVAKELEKKIEVI